MRVLRRGGGLVVVGEESIYPRGFNVFKRDGKEKIPTYFFLKSNVD